MEQAIGEKRYQLCRMVLINAGTNKNTASGRITSIDPRGGAAVLGANGVGKTTTLRLMPLFFGYLPSKLVAGSGGATGMLKFLLPDDTSAIAYEYRRGDTSDLRLAVLRRRQDDENAPMYRIYRCGFDERLFVKDGFFLADQEAQEQANTLGITGTRMLTSADYRAVILRTSNPVKDKRLRDYRLEHSFGPNSLDLLDRLMGAMLVDKVDLDDIVQVAVSRVQSNIGQAEHGKLPFKQKAAQIDDWVSLRRACEDALAQSSKVADQKVAIEEYAAIENQLRASWWNVSHLKSLKEKEQLLAGSELRDLRAGHGDQSLQDERQRSALEDEVRDSSEAARAARDRWSDLNAEQTRFSSEDAIGWEERIRNEEQLQARHQRLTHQIELATSAQTDVLAETEKLKKAAESETQQAIAGLQAAKEEPQLAYDSAIEEIAKKEAPAVQSAEQAADSAIGELQQGMEPLARALGEWAAKQQNPQPDPAHNEALRVANGALQANAIELNKSQTALAAATASQVSAKGAYDARELLVRQATARHADAERALGEVEALVSPAPGSLLYTLRQHPDESWKRNLAKTLDVGLLSRADLGPEFIGEDAPTLYGWDIHLESVRTPDWADDGAARAAVEAAGAKVAAAKSLVVATSAELGAKSDALAAATEAVKIAEAEKSVLEARAIPLLANKDKAELDIRNATSAALREAQERLIQLNKDLEESKRAVADAQEEKTETLNRIRREFRALREDAATVRKSALAQIDASIKTASSLLEAELAGLDKQLNDRLNKAGVDVDSLAKVKADAGKLWDDLVQIQNHKPFVQSWKDFLARGGAAMVAEAKTASELTQGLAAKALQNFNAHEEAVRKRNREFNAAVEKLEARVSRCETDASSLGHLLESFDGKPAYVAPTVTLDVGVDTLRGTVDEQRTELAEKMAEIRNRHTQLSSKLRSGHKVLTKFVEDWLSQDPSRLGSDIGQALALCQCHGQIGAEIVRQNNLELRTIFANIDALHTALQTFKTEVGRVNKQIQEGLSAVTCFERISELNLWIATNFEELGFYAKLRKMTALIQDYAVSGAYLNDRELAPRDIATALGDFASVVGRDGSLEINLGAYISIGGSVLDNGTLREFKTQRELEAISSNGLTSIVMICLMCALVNTMRGEDQVWIPWVTDEVGDFDQQNLLALMQMLKDNRIDIVTASPSLDLMQRGVFARRYLFEDRGRVRLYRQSAPLVPASASAEVQV
ncbi:ATP-binding protein [Acidovorax sp. sic0104]|uniref:ATP-binding protein n=1 Tax=Acidovorax sp. sic0104 TaxID=2854784 RepID=UPI001C479E50|nr:ATP-binding protein [Acidovorax sp. sic0104]MBV7542232.1 ATP-binding protein [Acidovorax sp. sic0104]